ncbi:hypothetical protein QBC42DRAFT_254748 [Cladorrhinum samala]|uniref:Uncharacterized protein n=1 Tax=Cladorrhinum samala TaxID=585594 RepID=A0AAV9HGY7_9PEZI|nr:hypothetical protein QBC42DRAFT_254748 [Cladorrhinum samala]
MVLWTLDAGNTGPEALYSMNVFQSGTYFMIAKTEQRHHRPNPPLTATTADPNAATAAAAVFKRHESNATLSAAAAAAALRARPMTPTRVGDVQTKRTLRRSASVASSRTASPMLGRPGLERRGSSGSMTERTFRSPSPHRPGSSGSGHRQSRSLSQDAPPVPALPKDVETSVGRSSLGAPPGARHRKSNSLGMGTTPVRLASERLKSDDAPSWFSAARLGDPSNVRRTDPAMASPPSSPPQLPLPPDELAEVGRPGSRASSINFSYPSRARVGSPPVSPVDRRASVDSAARISLGQPSLEENSTAHAPQANEPPTRQMSTMSPRRTKPTSSPSDQALVYDPNSRRMVRGADLRGVQQAVIEASQQPTGSRKKKRTPQKAGSHLAAGTMGRTKSNASTDVFAEKGPARGTVPRAEEIHPGAEPPIPSRHEEAEESAFKAVTSSPRTEAKGLEEQQRTKEIGTAAVASNDHLASISSPWQGIRRQPSIVKEEPEPEEQYPEKRFQRPEAAAPLQNINAKRQRVPAKADPETHNNMQSPQRAHTTLPEPGLQLPETSRPEVSHSPVIEPRRQAQVAHQRSLSNSPARQAHFGPVQENLTVKHSPPPRSISPRKSALKHSSPSRGASLSDDTSDASLTISHEAPVSRKKSVRVSFGDDTVNESGGFASVDRPISPRSSSPQESNRRRWFGSSGRDKDVSPLDDDEIMKPRPALPSFGSVRAKKPRDLSPDETERPLVRPPGETAQSTPASVSPGLLPSPPLGASSDHVIGGIFLKDLEEKVKDSASTSQMREPLPPVVTSVEGPDYFSDSSTPTRHSSDSEEDETFFEASDVENAWANGSANANAVPAVEPNTNKTREQQIPVISISQPTPPTVESKPPTQYFVDLPGGFPEDESDPSGASGPKGPTTANGSISTAKPHSTDTQHTTPHFTSTSQPTIMDNSSDSESSIYSDAYEDLPETGGDGFQSLDAVVESPVKTTSAAVVLSEKLAEQPYSTPPGRETSKVCANVPTEVTAVKSPPSAGPEDEWERVKAYWRNLSAEKRAQLEKEVREDAGIEADLEEEKPASKPKKKKSIERRNSERRALALHMAQQMAAQHQPDKPSAAERSYQIKPGTRWVDEEVADSNPVPTMRMSMRSPPPQQRTTSEVTSEAPRLRKSMRGPGPTSRSPEPLSSSTPAAIASAAAPAYLSPSSAPSPPVSSSTGMTSFLKRRDSSSSESSFKRLRPQGGGHVSGFRKSMRPTSPPSVQSDNRTSMRLSLRGSSPAGSLSQHGSDAAPAGAQMRRTLRDSSTGRKSPTGIHMPIFGKKSGSKASGRKSSRKFSSRFGDSSDEGDDGSATGFRSRFEDSSDDEPMAALPTSIPQSRSAPEATTVGRSLRTRGSIASTALAEELEESEELQEANMNGSRKQPGGPQVQDASALNTASPPVLSVETSLRHARSGRGSILAGLQTTPSLETAAISSSPTNAAFSTPASDERRDPAAPRRNSIMSVLRRKKHDSSGGGISRREPTESAARRDTKLERSMGQLKEIKSDAGVETPSPVVSNPNEAHEAEQQAQPAHKSPKLKKKALFAAPKHHQSPPVPRIPPGDDGLLLDDMDLKRTPTSGNLGTRTLSGTYLQHGQQQQQQQQQRQTFSAGAPSIDGGSIATSGGTPKKKRFGALRRMFRLEE